MEARKPSEKTLDVDQMIDDLLRPVMVGLRHRIKQILIVAANADANPSDMDRILAEQMQRDRIEVAS